MKINLKRSRYDENYRKCFLCLNGILLLMLLFLPLGRAEKQLHSGRTEDTTVTVDFDFKKKIALTFDDGPHPVYTEKLLDGLKERGVHVTFFLMGRNVELYPELVLRIQEEGHLIGNHTYSHLQLTSSTQDKFCEELSYTSQIISEITGVEVLYVRPPFGSWDKKLEKVLNMIPILWDIDPLDWCTMNAELVSNRVCAKAEENAIILMHDQYESSVEAAFRVIDQLTEEGYEFVTVDELIFE